MKYTISTEEELSAYPNNVHMRFFNETVQKGFWKQASNLSLFYAYAMHPHSKGCVVVSQGRAESVVKYAELIYDLYQNQFSVFIADHQGQGLSTRTQSNPHIGYVENFCDYVNDLHALIGHVLAPILKSANQDSLPINLLCHSMGGAIGCLYAQRFPQTFNKIAMSAPMVGIKAPLSETLMSIILSVHRLSKRLFNIKESYFWGQGDYQA